MLISLHILYTLLTNYLFIPRIIHNVAIQYTSIPAGADDYPLPLWTLSIAIIRSLHYRFKLDQTFSKTRWNNIDEQSADMIL